MSRSPASPFRWEKWYTLWLWVRVVLYPQTRFAMTPGATYLRKGRMYAMRRTWKVVTVV